MPYAVIGGNAVMAWVEQVDESAVRFTQDVDLVLRREDLDRACEALGKVGFVHRRSAGIEMFLDGPAAKARDAVYAIFSGEKIRPEYLSAVPDVADSVSFKSFRVLALEAVVQMKLTSYRDKDKTHVRDSPRGLGPNRPRPEPRLPGTRPSRGTPRKAGSPRASRWPVRITFAIAGAMAARSNGRRRLRGEAMGAGATTRPLPTRQPSALTGRCRPRRGTSLKPARLEIL